MNNTVASIMWIRLLANFIPSFVLFYVIYFVPARMGKITTHSNINISQSRNSSGEEDAEVSQLKQARETCLYENQMSKINSSFEESPERQELLDNCGNYRINKSNNKTEYEDDQANEFSHYLISINNERNTKVNGRFTRNVRKSLAPKKMSADE